MTADEVKELPIAEKFLLFEAIWDDFRDNFDKNEISEETKNLLDQRRERAESGESKLLDWEKVKSTIGRP